MEWNGRPTYCPHCGEKGLKNIGGESPFNTVSFNSAHYKCEICKNEMDISYSPHNFIELKQKGSK